MSEPIGIGIYKMQLFAQSGNLIYDSVDFSFSHVIRLNYSEETFGRMTLKIEDASGVNVGYSYNFSCTK
jgi:hypothetical protein